MVGLDTATPDPAELPEIIEVAVLLMDGPAVTRPPAVWWARPSQPAGIAVPAGARPFVRLAHPWQAVAAEVTTELSDRTLVMHHPDRITLLRWHLPNYPPMDTISTRDLARTTWPGLTDYNLGPLAVHARINTIPHLPNDATTEAHNIALLLLALLHHTTERQNNPPAARTLTRRPARVPAASAGC
ncbi:MAG TPA: hypothetical protein VLJ59_16590 [Mycobacteriales bacterium]|nr:hypothetical protein [Mycobacteriales bacterium]